MNETELARTSMAHRSLPSHDASGAGTSPASATFAVTGAITACVNAFAPKPDERKGALDFGIDAGGWRRCSAIRWPTMVSMWTQNS